MNKLERLHKLKSGTETAVWAHDEILSQDKRIAELELWIECAIKPNLQLPEWVRVSATSLLNKKKGGDK